MGTGGPSGLACAGLEPRLGEQLIPLPALTLLPGPTQLLGCCFGVVPARGTERVSVNMGAPEDDWALAPPWSLWGQG